MYENTHWEKCRKIKQMPFLEFSWVVVVAIESMSHCLLNAIIIKRNYPNSHIENAIFKKIIFFIKINFSGFSGFTHLSYYW